MENKKTPFNYRRAIFIILIFFFCIIIIGVLKIASAVILPITIAVLLSITMYPLVKLLEKLRFPHFLSIFIVISLIIAGIYGIGVVLFSFGKAFASHYFSYYENRLNDIYIIAARYLDLSYDEDLSFFRNIWGQLGVQTFIRDFAFTSSNILFQFIKSAVIMVLFIGFILVEAAFFREKLELAFKNNSDRINKIARDLMTQVMRYLTAKFLISFATGVIFTVSFYFIGLQYAVVWGVIQFVLNFIPALGSIVAGFIISLFTLLQFWPDPTPVIQVIVILFAVNLIIGNIIDPKIVGKHVGISPLMIMISLLIWGWIWGFAGMILAVPMTVTIKLVCENIPIMKPVAVLMGVRLQKQKKFRSWLKKKNTPV
jgi:predicted PurR-regulated permease PerM